VDDKFINTTYGIKTLKASRGAPEVLGDERMDLGRNSGGLGDERMDQGVVRCKVITLTK